MPTPSSPITDSKDLRDLEQKVKNAINELYFEKVGGSSLGDVFTIGSDDIFTLKISVGLEKVSGRLAVKAKSGGGIKAASDGISVKQSDLRIDDFKEGEDNTDLDSSATRHGLLPKLSGDASTYLDGSGGWTVPSSWLNSWPVGSVYLETTNTNPATLLGFGTWVSVGSGALFMSPTVFSSEYGTVTDLEDSAGSTTVYAWQRTA